MARRTFSKKKQQKTPKTVLVRVALGVGACLAITAVIASVYYLTRIQSLQITDVEVSGGVTLSHAQIEGLTTQALDGSYAHVIPKQFRFLYPKQEIEQSVSSLPKVKEVEVSLVEGDTVSVAFVEYKPTALWCFEDTTQPCMFLDETGYAFAVAPDLTGTTLMRYVQTGAAAQTTQTQAFDPEFIARTRAFVDMVEHTFLWQVSVVRVYDTYDIEYFLSQGGSIKTSQSLSAQESFANLQFVLQSQEFAHVEPGSFVYIDLRFGDKVFIKEDIDDPALTSTSSESVLEQ